MGTCWIEQAESDLPADNEWLSALEFAKFNTLRVPKRRADWRLGRWTAKQAVAGVLGISADQASLRRIVIHPADTGEPLVHVFGFHNPITISLSHRDGRALCVVALGAISLGCDLELSEPKSDAFISDYFTLEEQELVASVPPFAQSLAASLVWSAKESALKALHVGLRVDTRSVAVDRVIQKDIGRSDGTWRPMLAHCADQVDFHGWWRYEDGVIRTVMSDVLLDPPVQVLQSSSSAALRQEDPSNIKSRTTI
jgi:4'-phosphopantetheinyl transferase